MCERGRPISWQERLPQKVTVLPEIDVTAGWLKKAESVSASNLSQPDLKPGVGITEGTVLPRIG